MSWQFNPFTGTFDKVGQGGASVDVLDKAICHTNNSAGFPLQVFCPELNAYLPAGPQLVFSNDGRIVRIE